MFNSLKAGLSLLPVRQRLPQHLVEGLAVVRMFEMAELVDDNVVNTRAG